MKAYVSRRRTSHQVPDLVGFSIDEEDWRGIKLQSSDLDGHLDAAGRASFKVKLDSETQRGPELVTCDVTVTDPGWDMVAASSSAVVHPGEVYVALESMRWGRVHPGKLLKPKVLTVTPEGARRSKPVKLELLQHLKDPKRSWDTLPGKVVATCDVTTQKEPVTCSLTAPPGPYDDTGHFVLRATTADPRGPVSASVRLYPGLPPKPTPPPPVVKKPEKPRPVAKLELDAPTHARGEVARFRAQSPFKEGHLLFTVEREGILEHRVMPVNEDPVELEFKVDAATAPRVWGTATFVSPLADTTSYRRNMGTTTTLDSGWEDRRLEVAIKPGKSQATPGEEMDVDVDVRMQGGQPARAEVTLYAADEATLGLAHYKLPEPMPAFFASPDHVVEGVTTRDALGHVFDWEAEIAGWKDRFKGIRGFGTGTGMGYGSGHGRLGGSHSAKAPQIRMGATSVEEARRNFKQTAFFFPNLATDENGHVRAHVKLPDSLTTYRVMAFAVTRSAEVGTAQTPIMTSMPLQVRPILPRVIRVGDRFAIAAMVANNGRARLEGKVALALDGLEAKGAPSQSVSLGGGEAQRLTFDVEAKAAGKGKIVLAVEGGDGLRDSAELPISVETPVAMEAAALHGSAEGQVDELLGELAGVRSDVGSLEVTLSSSPLAGLGAGLDQLVKYPYGCTEQTTSRLVPLLPLRDLARSLSVVLPPDIDAAATEAVRRLQGNQQKDGGFGLWPGSTESSPWLSAYATWGLEVSRRHKIPVDERARARAHGHLLELLARWSASPGGRAAAPFALDVLADAVLAGGAAATEGSRAPEQVDLPSLRLIADQMFDGRAELPLFSRALLLHAMGVLGSPPERVRTLTTELVSGVHLDGPLARYVGSDPAYWPMFDSPVRTSALVLRALLVVDPAHVLVTPLALGLVTDRNGGTWRTTQETAWALLALDDYRRKTAPGPTRVEGRVLLGGAPALSHVFSANAGEILPDVTKTIPMSQVLAAAGQPLSFVGQGSGAVHYQALLRFAPQMLPVDDLASGMEIHRRYYVIQGNLDAAAVSAERWRTDATVFTEGAMILSEVEVITPSTRRWVVLDDPIPGGFESVDLDLQGGPRWLRRYIHEGRNRTEHRDDRVLMFSDELRPGWHRFAHVVRATAAGTFVTPPARVEEMYTPETFGRTSARVVTITPAKNLRQRGGSPAISAARRP